MKKVIMLLVRVAAVLALCIAANAPVSAHHEICNPTCITLRCSSNDDCTAAGFTRCDFACHQIGCCV